MSEISPPRDLQHLIERTHLIAGRSLSSLAQTVNVDVPENLMREKGWVGQLIEKVLGANAGNKPEPDFVDLGIELKTLPINTRGKPSESTYVCVVPLSNTTGLDWSNSVVKSKLNHVLWVPIESNREIPLGERKIGCGIFWKPDQQTSRLLAQDYNDFIEKISLGEIETITAHQGEILQIRPKAANASVLTEGIGETGQAIRTLPRGFYLRSEFTNKIIQQWKASDTA